MEAPTPQLKAWRELPYMASGTTPGSPPRRMFAALQLIPGRLAMPTLHAQRSRLWENLRAGIRGLENTPGNAVEQENKLLFLGPFGRRNY